METQKLYGFGLLLLGYEMMLDDSEKEDDSDNNNLALQALTSPRSPARIRSQRYFSPLGIISTHRVRIRNKSTSLHFPSFTFP
jgi:hypothetical protein